MNDSNLKSLFMGRWGSVISGILSLLLHEWGPAIFSTLGIGDAELAKLSASASAIMAISLASVSKLRANRASINKLSAWLVIAVMPIIMSCSIIQPVRPWCDRIPAGEYSVICEVAKKVGTNPESVAMILETANLANLSQNKYTAEQADSYIADMLSMATTLKDRGATYQYIVEVVTFRYNQLPAEVKASLIILNKYATLNIPEVENILLSKYDWDGIIVHLEEQKAIVAPFLQ
jgi:hypothetical protein